MKRQLLGTLLALLCVLFASQQASALNAYAYGLSSTYEDGTLTVTYSLNAEATSVSVVVMNDTTAVYTATGTTTVGTNTVTIADSELPQGVELTWKVVVNSATVSTPTVGDVSYRFYHPQGVEVDNDPESPYFGRIYTTECLASSSSTYHSYYTGTGLYVFDPTLTAVTNSSGNPGFTGGMTMQKYLTEASSTTAYDPRKIRISEDGRVFLTRQQTGGVSPIVEVDPSDLNANFKDIFSGTYDSSTYSLLDSDGNYIIAPNVGFDVKGSGDDLTLLVLSSKKNGFSASSSGFTVDEYKLGTNTTWSAVPTSNISALTGVYTVSRTNTNVTYDNVGGIWYSQYRAAPSESEPTFKHINASGEVDYSDVTTVAAGAGFRFNLDFTRVAIADAKAQIGIYTVSYDSVGAPVLTLEYQFSTTIGSNCNDIAWDIADNLYIVGNSSEYLKVFALPRSSGEVETPAASSYAFTVPVSLASNNAYAYDITVTTADDVATVSYRLNAPANSVKVQLLCDGAVYSEVDGTTYANEDTNLNTATISLADLGVGDYSYQVVVNSDVVTTPTEYSKSYRFYHPQAVEVDNNTNSPYFGRVYVTECLAASSTTYHSYYTGTGLYVFDPTLTAVTNSSGNPGFTGGMTMQKYLTESSSTTAYDPRKIRISEDGRVFLTRQQTGNISHIVEVDPSDLNANFKDIFSGTYDSSTYSLLDSDGNYIIAPNVGFDVKGSGDDLTLLVLSSKKNGFSASFSGFTVDEYKLGTNTTWSTVPTNNISALTGQYVVSRTNTNVVYDNVGGIWLAQYRASPTEAQPSLKHVNANGEIDYTDITMVCRAGGFRFNADFTRVAIADASTQIGIYTVSYDSAGAPVLTLEYQFATNIGGNCNDMAWDAADNLYIVGNTNEYLKVFALPRSSGDVTVAASSDYDFSILPTTLYAVGDLNSDNGTWKANDGTYAISGEDGVYTGTIEVPYSSTGYASFAVSGALGSTDSDWDTFNAYRYGPVTDSTTVVTGESTDIERNSYTFQIDATGTLTIYTIEVNLNDYTLTVKDATSGVETVYEIEGAKAIGGVGQINIIGNASNIAVYTIGGVLVSKGETTIECQPGYYIVVLDNKSVKVAVK